MIWIVLFLSGCASITQLKDKITGDPQVKASITEGNKHLDAKEYAKAAVSFEQAGTRELSLTKKRSYAVLTGLGKAYMNTKREKEACPLFEEATKEELDDQAYLLLAQCYTKTKKLNKAKKVYKTLQKKKDKPDYHLKYGEILTKQGDHLGAQKSFEKASLLDPSNQTSAKSMLGVAYAQTGQFKKSQTILGDLVTKSSSTPLDRKNMALLRKLEGKKDDS